ncbi:MAG TPA: hypothetical protein VMT46_06335 [Anaerolineaceae bacterium]|nr:hypothetical protein [Anaerolineaceae bacterium]
MKTLWMYPVLVIVILSLLAAACSPAATPTTAATPIPPGEPQPTGSIPGTGSETDTGMGTEVIATPATDETSAAVGEITVGEGTAVILADDGATVKMKVGQRFLLQLGEDYDWNVTVADQNVLSRVVNITVVRGAQGLYEAHQAGTTGLTAVGDPPCRTATPACAMPSRSFMVTIVVE